MKKSLLAAALSLLVLSVLATPADAARKKAPTAPGVYADWDGEVDELEVVKTFALADYAQVVVEAFDTKNTPLPEADDNTYEPVKKVLVDPASSFLEGLNESLDGKIATGRQAGDGKALKIRAEVVNMDPGSQAARYWGGFGAGAARVALRGEVVDAGTGEVLLRFRQERRSGTGVAGGDYVKLMNRSLRTIGEDVAGVLLAF